MSYDRSLNVHIAELVLPIVTSGFTITSRKSLSQAEKFVGQRIQYLIMHVAPTISAMSEDNDICPVYGYVNRVSNLSHPSSFALYNAILSAYIILFSASSKTLTTLIASRWTDCLMVKTLQIHHFVLKSNSAPLLQVWVCERPWAERRNWALQSTMGDWVSAQRDGIAPRLHFGIVQHLIILKKKLNLFISTKDWEMVIENCFFWE